MQNEVLNFGSDVHAKDPKAVYYLITFLFSFATSIVSATYVLFLLSQHLDLLQVNLVNLAFMTGNFLFEIPTGVYADYFGRKNSVVLSSTLVALAFGTYFLSSSFFMFIIAEMIAALAITFSSGALDAWLVDSLEQNSFVGNVDYVFSHASILGQLAALFGGLIGAYIGSVSLRLPLGFAALLSLLSVVVALLFMYENRRTRETFGFSHGLNQLSKIAKEGVIYGVRHKVILWLVLSSILASFALQPLNMYWSPRFNTLAGNQVWIVGWVWAGMCLFMMFGGLLVKKLLRNGKKYLEISIITALFIGIPIIAASFSNIFYFVLTTFLTYEIGRGMFNPIHKSYLNKYIPSEHRATVLSFDSMMGKVGAAGGLVLLGLLAKSTNIQTAWFVSGIILLFLIPIYLRAGFNEKRLSTE